MAFFAARRRGREVRRVDGNPHYRPYRQGELFPAAAALRHAARRGPGAPQAPSEASLEAGHRRWSARSSSIRLAHTRGPPSWISRRLSLAKNSAATLDSGRQGSEAGRQMPLVLALLGALRAALGARSDLVLENLALRQQLALLRRRAKRPRFGQTRSPLLDVALAAVGAVARGAPCRSAADRHSLAEAGLPRLLELEVPTRSNRSTACRLRGCKARSHHGPRQSPLGRAAHPW